MFFFLRKKLSRAEMEKFWDEKWRYLHNNRSHINLSSLKKKVNNNKKKGVDMEWTVSRCGMLLAAWRVWWWYRVVLMDDERLSLYSTVFFYKIYIFYIYMGSALTIPLSTRCHIPGGRNRSRVIFSSIVIVLFIYLFEIWQ